VAAIYPKVIEAGDSELLRVAAEPYKKLQDEVRPALIYATNELPAQAEIQFHLSDRGPDATAWPHAHSAPLLIEVTVASGKVRHAQMKALNETGVGHGFTDATDADTTEQIKARYDDCGAHSPDEVCANLGAAIRLCVEQGRRKTPRPDARYPCHTKQVLAEEWDRCMSEIRRTLPPSPYQAIFVVGYALGTGDVCRA
jgi:hypothetical protein